MSFAAAHCKYSALFFSVMEVLHLAHNLGGVHGWKKFVCLLTRSGLRCQAFFLLSNIETKQNADKFLLLARQYER
jgi:hypothetical protein